MKRYGLIGYPVSHSFSPAYFQTKFQELNCEASYEAIAIQDIKEINALVDAKGWSGFNVTIPHKISILPFLKEISQSANAIGAVNTVSVTKAGWYGFNTDWIGFTHALLPLLKPEDKSALILGEGGASQAVKYALKRLNINFQSVSRNGPLKFKDLHPSHIKQVQLIINTTPLGTYPLVEGFPDLPYEAITKQHLLFDLVYNPQETLFLLKGKALGARVLNGLEMLQKQADESFNIWNSAQLNADLAV